MQPIPSSGYGEHCMDISCRHFEGLISTDRSTTAKKCKYYNVLEHLITVVQELSLARNMETIVALVRTVARNLLGADGATFVLRDRDYCFYTDEETIASHWQKQPFPIQTCLGGWTMLNRQPAVIPNMDEILQFPCTAYRSTFVKSVIMVPIRISAPIGAIGVYWKTLHQPELEDIKFLQALADATAVAMENIQTYVELEQRVRDRTAELEATNQRLLKEIQERQAAESEIRLLSLTDELTELYNRRGFFLLVEQQLKLARRMQTPYCLLFIDLDGVKKINDTLGHEMGDMLLVDAAQVLTHTFRDSDIVSRYGGDEFAVLVCDCSDVEEVYTRLQTNITAFNQTADRWYELSMSIGAECFTPDNHLPLEQLIARADELMYICKRSKQEGNRECSHSFSVCSNQNDRIGTPKEQ
jgi:diguanylate cyclase (GGDEF)-like protein